MAHHEDSHTMAMHLAQSGTNWLVGSCLLWSFEIYFLPSRLGVAIRRMHFIGAIAVKSLLVVVTVIAVALFGRLVFQGLFDFGFFLEPAFYRIMAMVFIVIILLQTTTQIVRIVGGRAPVNFVLGRYYRPVRENTVFLFLDLAGSTALAEKLGDVGVQTMITNFFFDITEPIIEWEGEIHRYVGDQVVVTWPLATAPENLRAINCCFAIQDFVEKRKSVYAKKFGTVPEFRIGLHGGPVVISQVGDQKQEISYFGDTVNTAARIEQKCKELDEPLLISAELLAVTDLAGKYQAVSKGSYVLTGRRNATELFALARQSVSPEINGS